MASARREIANILFSSEIVLLYCSGALRHPGKRIENLASSFTPQACGRFGAYLALRDRRVDAVPALVEMLAKYSIAGEVFGQSSGDRHDAILEVLDALIQLGSLVPAAEAQRIYPDFPVQSLILLSRSKIVAVGHSNFRTCSRNLV